MKNFIKCSVVLLSVWTLAPLSAQPIDGFVSPAFVFSSVGGASRTRLEMQFSRLQKNVELDFSLGNGSGYSDYGAVFRVFNHFPLGGDGMATGVSVGLGVGAFSASKGLPRPYIDLAVSPFVRAIYDFGIGLGVAIEGGLQMMPYRKFSDDSSPTSSSDMRNGFFAGATLVVSSRWLE